MVEKLKVDIDGTYVKLKKGLHFHVDVKKNFCFGIQKHYVPKSNTRTRLTRHDQNDGKSVLVTERPAEIKN